jgi:hypothetical protein
MLRIKEPSRLPGEHGVHLNPAQDVELRTWMEAGGVSLEVKRDRKGCALGPHLELKVRLRVSISTAKPVLTTSVPPSCRMYHYHSERYFRVSVSSSKGHETLHHSRLKLIVRLSCQGLLGPICRRSTLLQGGCSESFEAYCSTYPSLPRNVCVSCINSDQSTARPSSVHLSKSWSRRVALRYLIYRHGRRSPKGSKDISYR